MKLKDWSAHIEELIKRRPDLAEAHIVRDIRCDGTYPLQLWCEDLPPEKLEAGPEFVYLLDIEWEPGEYPL